MATSRSHSPKSVQSLLSDSDGTLAHLLARAGELSRLNRLLTTLLPAPLASHVRACAIHSGTLVLQTDSPAWSTRLRLEQHKLLAGIRAIGDLAGIAGIRVTVAIPTTPQERQALEPRLSQAAATTLAQCAESQSDSSLRAALVRLSRRT